MIGRKTLVLATLIGAFAAAGSLAGCSSTDTMGALALAEAPRSTSKGLRFGDHDPYDFTGTAPWHHEIHGVDVAKYQNSIDWPRVRSAGINFAFIKATEGGDGLDSRFRENWAAAKAAGIPRGAYHFFYWCRNGSEQADWYIRNVPKEKGALPPVIDAEWNMESPTCAKKVPAATAKKWLRQFADKVTRHYGQTPIMYTTVDFYRDNRLADFDGVQFWLRSTAGHPSEKYVNQNWMFWQYTGTGKVPGISTPTDINVFRGDAGDFRNWLRKNT